MNRETPSQIDRAMAQICVACLVCRHARKKQAGVAYWFTSRVETRLCPFCRAFERVYKQKAHRPFRSRIFPMQSSLSRFDQEALAWDNNPVRVALAGAVGQAITAHVPLRPDWRVIDYGAGTGLLTLRLQGQVAHMLALDASAGMLEQLSLKLAGASIRNVQTRQCNLEQAPLAELGFDLVVSSMTFHHLKDIPVVLERLSGMLKPNGWLAIADLDSEDGSFHGKADDVFHHGFERVEFGRRLEAAGIGNVRCFDVQTLKKPDACGQLRDYSVFLAVGQKGAVG